MNFKDLYNNNCHSVKRALTAMWCGESANDSQKSYAKQLKEIIGDLFAPCNAMPVVQCMNSYEPVHSISEEDAKAIVGGLWKAPYSPYEHQYKCWNTLLNTTTADGKPKSIVVTTGTGSGKTECFMMPLIHDLSEHHSEGYIQALFLYPLNALMEDQKERMEEMLNIIEKEKGIRLTYTVYNGDLPESEPNKTDNSIDAQKQRRHIEQITGGEYVEVKPDDPKEKPYFVLQNAKYSHLVYTRKAVRLTPPSIVLTNPTMLEYILLRGTDEKLVAKGVNENEQLRWIAIDETHSYTGAGAAELAMLLRRVLLAFNVDATDIRFATSSATFGNGADPAKDEQDLKEFIAGITGARIDQIEAVSGKRLGEDSIPAGEDAERWKQIFHADYISLEELYPGDYSIEERLSLLDQMCEREEKRCMGLNKTVPDMRLKVHYFYRVPNNGLYVRLDEFNDGSFKIFTENVIGADKEEKEKNPLLELARCKNCGEYVAIAAVNTDPRQQDGWSYEPLMSNDSDMFDLYEDEIDDSSSVKYAIFGLSDTLNAKGDNNSKFKVLPSGKILPMTPFENPQEGDWHLVGNLQCKCPYCNTKQTRKRDKEKDIEGDANGNMENTRLQKFRLSAEFISRLLAPSILDQLEKGASQNGAMVMHDGQQYISFVDSRQAAAKATLKQNLEQERMWVYSTIYHELCRRKACGLTKDAAIAQVTAAVQADPLSMLKYAPILANLQSPDPAVVQKQLSEMAPKHITWGEITSLLRNDPYCPIFASVFVKRSGDSEELENGKPSDEMIDKYVQSIMVMYLAHRPASAASPENMGLFESCYPQLRDITLPDAVKAFNDVLSSPSNRITEADWQHLLQIYIDFTVRNNQSFYLRIPGNDKIDIFSTVRFATEKPRRRPFNKPQLERGKISTARIVRYLCALISRDDMTLSIDEAQRQYFDIISGVIDALWDTLTGETYKILQVGERLNDNGKFELERDNAPRFNLYNLCFKLYDDVYLCDTRATEDRHTISLRPIGNNFKRFSPYLEGTKPVELKEDLHELWDVYPYFKGSDKQIKTEEIEKWAKENRKLLWNNHIWGEDGVFYDRLVDIHAFPNLFIQQEHTAQVDKSVAGALLAQFKDHTVNIMACSTTMEMGVDLGNLEVVLLSSVPPQPANYKQRAGRSGRNNKVKSVCITLCGSDVLGLRTLRNPIERIIKRSVKVPSVDLKSPQIVQRHVNSFLVRSFGVFTDGANGGRLTQKVADYYTNFEIRVSNERIVILDGSTEVDPNHLLGNPQGTMYEAFNIACTSPLETAVHDNLQKLLAGTVFHGQISKVVKNAKEANERCYAELRNKLVDYKTAFTDNGPISEAFRLKLKMQYMEVLFKRLLNFWATSRFTPNANMPVNVLALDLNSSGKKSFFTPTTSSNPSYSLRDAISQYAPGNSIVVDGVVYTVRGVEITNMYDNNPKAFKTIYRNNDRTVIDDASLPNQIRWAVNENNALELIQPAGFLPDMNESSTRIIDSNAYTHVSAQLIGASDWSNHVTEPHLYSVRKNTESGEAKILYYNEGRGFGYCFCTRCGRMVLEDGVADVNEPKKFPFDFNPQQPAKREDGTERPRYHFAITGKDMKKRCSCSDKPDKVRRNVIIGDLIQTDYSEIRIRHKGSKKWMSERNKEEKLLFTLGIVFTQSLTEILGKERDAVDFSIMPNGHICIFDCNPGGAGYSNMLANVQVMQEVIQASKHLLEEAKLRKSKDMLLDKFTLRFAKYIDIQAALDWIYEEEESGKEIPLNVKSLFANESQFQTSMYYLQKALIESNTPVTIFVNDGYKDWDYDYSDQGWYSQFFDTFVQKSSSIRFCLVQSTDASIPDPIMSIIREIGAWAKGDKIKTLKNAWANENLYPIAYINGYLYLTNNVDCSNLNAMWGNETLFAVKTSDPYSDTSALDTSFKASTKLLIFNAPDTNKIKSNSLGKVLCEKSSGIIDSFIEHCKANPEAKVKITYQDEHMKSALGMVFTLQTIEYFVMQMKNPFSLRFKVENYYQDNGLRSSIMANLPNSEVRDTFLNNLLENWKDDLRHLELKGEILPVASAPKGSLTHWRVLSFECDGKVLSIYPDGGFMNGWCIQSGDNPYIKLDDLTLNTYITLTRTQDIKFDVIIEDI